MVGVAFDSAHLVGPYAREHELSFPLVVLDDRRTAALYRVTRVPLTMVVDGSGRVRFARIGQLTDPAAIDSVRAALTAPLPEEGETEDDAPIRPVSTAGTGP